TPGACCRARRRPLPHAIPGNERGVDARPRRDIFLTVAVGRCRPQNAAQEAPMSNPNNPNDPESLSLAPGGSGKKADFSNVQGGSSSTEADAPRADFSNVQGGSSSTEESIGEQTYTV